MFEHYVTQVKIKVLNPKDSTDYIITYLDIPDPDYLAKTDRDSIVWGDLIQLHDVSLRAYNSVRGGLVRALWNNQKAKVEILQTFDNSDDF